MLEFALNAISNEAMNGIYIALTALMALISVAIIVVVLMQEGESGGVSAITGGNSDTFYEKNKGRSKEQILKKVTLILGALMLVLSLVFFILKITG